MLKGMARLLVVLCAAATAYAQVPVAAAANGNRRIHALRTAVAGEREFRDPLRSDGHHRRGEVLLQSDSQGQRGQRRVGD